MSDPVSTIDGMVPLAALIDAERRAAAAEAKLELLEQQLASRRRSDRDRQEKRREKLSHSEPAGNVTSRDVTLPSVTARDPLSPQVSSSSPTPPITTSFPPHPDTTNIAAADPEGHNRLSGALQPPGAVELDAFLARLPDNNRRRSWIRRLLGALDGDGGKTYTAEELSLALADMNANGELNRARFLGYLAMHRTAQATSDASTAGHNAASPHRTSARDLEAQGLVIWGDLVDGISQVYKANDPNDSGAGGSNVWTIRAPTWDKLDDSARRALAAIGGAVAIATADAARKGFLSAQFAKTYAGAMMQSTKAAAAA